MDIGQSIIMILKVAFRTSFVVGAVVAFLAVFGLGVSTLAVALNAGILADLISLVQIWLPFNLVPILVWLVTVALAYLYYRLLLMALFFVQHVLND